MPKAKEKDLPKLDPFTAKRLADSREAEARYEATLDPRQKPGKDAE